MPTTTNAMNMELGPRVRSISSSQDFSVLKRSLIFVEAPNSKPPNAADRWKKAKHMIVNDKKPFNSLSWQIDRCTGLCVVGLGSFQDNEQRIEQRHKQLALSLALHGLLLPSSSLTYIDPMFTHKDVLFLKELGGTVLPQVWDPELVSSTSPPLYYMPCCPRSLVASVLSDILSHRSNQPNINPHVLIGNSLQAFVDSAFLCQDNIEELEATREIEHWMTLLRVREVPLPDIGGAHGVAISLHFIS